MTQAQLIKTAPNTFKCAGDELNSIGLGEIFNVEFNDNKQRTQPQNAAIHVYCDQLGRACNDAGYDKQAVYALMKDGYQVPWSKDSVKTDLWHPIQEAMFNIKSTTKLNRLQVSEVYMNLNAWTDKKLGISLPFPSRN